METPETTFLGIDGGGSKTAVTILASDQRIIGSGIGGPGNIAVNSDEVLSASIRNAIVATGMAGATRYRSVCAGMAGYTAELRRAEFERLLRSQISAERYRIEPDYVIAYWGATHGEPGVVAVAGTGAVAFGRNSLGETYRADGLGYLLGDRGSGFELGIYSLRYALETIQNGTSDSLTAAIVDFTGAPSTTAIIQWLYGSFSPSKVASLATVVGELAEAGDGAARNLVAEMAMRLRNTVREVRSRLGMPRDVAVYPIGGLWKLGSFLNAEFENPTWKGANGVQFSDQSTSGGPFRVVAPKSDPAYGAALLAMEGE